MKQAYKLYRMIENVKIQKVLRNADLGVGL